MKELSAITRCYDLILWLVPLSTSFPGRGSSRWGGCIEAICLETLEALIEAKYTRGKADILRRVNLRLETLRYLIRLSTPSRPVPSMSGQVAILCSPENHGLAKVGPRHGAPGQSFASHPASVSQVSLAAIKTSGFPR